MLSVMAPPSWLVVKQAAACSLTKEHRYNSWYQVTWLVFLSQFQISFDFKFLPFSNFSSLFFSFSNFFQLCSVKCWVGWLNYDQGELKIGKKFAQIFFKKSPKQLPNKKCLNIFIKAQCENPKHLHRTFSKFLKYFKQTIFPQKNSLGL